MILLCGHGSQQPDDDPANPDDVESDGLDEIFLPCDVDKYDGQRGAVTNAITDDQQRAWLVQLLATGARVWVVVDACHSETMVRGTEVSRQVPPHVLVPT